MRISTVSLLVKRQFKENQRIYGLSLFILFGFLCLMFLIVHQWQDSFAGAVQNGVFIIGLFISGAIFSNSMLNEFSSKPGSIWILTLPAKHSEKIVASIFISAFVFQLVYICIFYIVDGLYIFHTIGWHPNQLLSLHKGGFHNFIYIYLTLNGIILLGSVVFRKYSLLKTLFFSFLLLFLINLINNKVLELFIPNIDVLSSIPFNSFLFVHQSENISVNLPFYSEKVSLFFLRILLPILIWLLAWLKLKEKQV